VHAREQVHAWKQVQQALIPQHALVTTVHTAAYGRAVPEFVSRLVEQLPPTTCVSHEGTESAFWRDGSQVRSWGVSGSAVCDVVG